MSFLHGIEVVQRSSSLKPIRSAPTSIIGVVGSAGKGPVNTPTLIAGDQNKAVTTFGADGTLPDALTAIFAQAGATVVAINVHDPAVRAFAEADYTLDGNELALPATNVASVAVKDSTGRATYLAAATVVAAADITAVGGEIDLTGHDVTDVVVKAAGGIGAAFTADTDYTVDAATGTITLIQASNKITGLTQTLNVAYTRAADYTVDAATGTITRATNGPIAAGGEVKVAFRGAPKTSTVSAADIRGAAGQNPTGIAALASAESVTGYAPRLLIAPGYTDDETTAQALIGIADRLRGVAIIDGPSTTDAAARTYRANFDARRGYLVDPGVRVADADGAIVDRPASAYVAGLIARIDSEVGFWRSPSNHVVAGVVGTARPISFGLSDVNSEANLLNAQNVATVVRQNGYRLWGSRTLSTDTAWAFLSVVRIADALTIALQASHLWAVDRNIGPTYLEEVAAAVNAYIAELIAAGALLAGNCRPSPDLNTTASLASGQVYFDVDFTPPTPAERVTFRTRLVTQSDLEEESA